MGSLLRNLEDYCEARPIVLRQEIFDSLQCVAWYEALSFRVLNTQILKEENVFLAKEAVLEIADYLIAALDRKTSELISKFVPAMFDPIENLALGVLCFGKNRVSIDAQSRIQSSF